MRALAWAAFACSLLASAAHAADDALSVTFVDPEHFRDAGFDREGHTDPSVLAGIEKHLHRLAQRYLADGQKLEVKILDVDLAGRLEPWRGLNGVRYLSDITWPRIRLHYALVQ